MSALIIATVTVALACTGAGVLYLGLALVQVSRRARAVAGPVGQPAPSVTILKPLHGIEPGLYDNLASFCRQDYPGSIEVVFGVQSPGDPAIAVVENVRKAFPELAIGLVVDATLHGSNRKVSNLINMSRRIRHEVVVLADSDMRVEPDYLGRIVGSLAQPGVGAVTCLYHGIDIGTLWSRLSALSIDTHFLPGVIVGTSLGVAEPCFGSTIALGRDTLAQVGDFRALANDLADDHALGAAVRRGGLAVTIPAFSIGHVCPERSGGDLVNQELRWQRTVRQVDPVGHAGSILSHPLAFALLTLVLMPGPVGLGAVVVALLGRLSLCLAVERAFGLRRHAYWLIPLRDLLSFGLFVASFFGRRVMWRGHRYDVAREGVLVPRRSPDPT